MNLLENLIKSQNPSSLESYKHSLLKAIQNISLLGLWRAGFFEYAAFYGGTALSIVHHLDRFSEDLDFSLLTPNENFSLEPFLKAVRTELKAWGIDATTGIIDKKDSNIESAFIKTNTMMALTEIRLPASILHSIHRNEISHIKIEIDPNPPCPFDSTFTYILEPIPFSVRVMSLSDIYAGKMHAILARKWKNRVKGRDWYDLIWFISQQIELDLCHLQHRLLQSGHLVSDSHFAGEVFMKMLISRIDSVDFNQAKEDVMPFVQDTRKLDLWSKEFFTHLVDRIKVKSSGGKL